MLDAFDQLLPWLAAAAVTSYILVSCFIAHRLSLPPARGHQAAVGHEIAGRQLIHFPSRGAPDQRVAAWFVPAADARGAVVVAHGIGMHKDFSFETEQARLVLRLVDSGLSVLAIDLRGHGDSDSGRLSYGFHERLDVLGAVDWLLGKGYRPGTIGLLGASMGAVASIAAAAEEPAVGAVVADSAYAHFGAMLWRNFLRRTPLRVGRALLPGTMIAGRWLLGTYMHRFSPAALAQRLRDRPLLLIHAEGDRMVPRSHAEWLSQSAQAPLWVTPGGAHLSSFADQPDVYRQRVFGFFDTHLARSTRAAWIRDLAFGDVPVSGTALPLAGDLHTSTPR